MPAPQQQQQMPTPPIGSKVREHLEAGGGVLALFLPQSDALDEALRPWGVRARTDLLAVHERIESTGATGDMIDEARRVPFIFVLNKYGDHPLTKPLQSLDALIVPLISIETLPTKGYSAASLLPVPLSPKSWGETDVDGAIGQQSEVKFEPDKGDVPAPIFGGAAVEKAGGGRLVALGSVEFVTNRIMNIPDPQLASRNIAVARFPGNAELFVNSIFWLSRMDTMIAISPAAMDVSRIRDMSPAALTFWRLGVLMIGLPGLIVVSGCLVYLNRRA